MKKEYKDLSIEDKKEYHFLTDTKYISWGMYMIIFMFLGIVASFNNNGVFLYKTALLNSIVVLIVGHILYLFDMGKIRKLFGL